MSSLAAPPHFSDPFHFTLPAETYSLLTDYGWATGWGGCSPILSLLLSILPYLHFLGLSFSIYSNDAYFVHMSMRTFYLSRDHFHASSLSCPSSLAIYGHRRTEKPFADIFSLPLLYVETYGRPCLRWIFARV